MYRTKSVLLDFMSIALVSLANFFSWQNLKDRLLRTVQLHEMFQTKFVIIVSSITWQ